MLTFDNPLSRISVMANEPMKRGPTAERVAGNIRRLRRERGLDLSDVSARLIELGHPVGLNTLSKIERGLRRVDVDDLMALALALDVTPNRLLLTATADDPRLALTGTNEYATSSAWRWASGNAMLPRDPARTDLAPEVDLDRLAQFVRENRPHDPPDTTLGELRGHRDQLDKVEIAVDVAEQAGISRQAIIDWLALHDTTQRAPVVHRHDIPECGDDDGER